MPHQCESVFIHSARCALARLLRFGARLVACLLIAYCASVARRDHSDPPTRRAVCGDGTYQLSSIAPRQSQWQGSAEQQRFSDALEQLEALMYCLHTDEVLGCSGQQPTLCFRCTEIGMNEKCAYHDWGGGWSWTTDLRSCLVQSRPNEDFFSYVNNGAHRGLKCGDGRADYGIA